MIAALFVQPRGCYHGIDGIEPWGLPERDARDYNGPWPVIAHPPCARWGRYWSGGPSAPGRFSKGDDDGCFAAAHLAVLQWGGVIEHPEGSHAWPAFGLHKPPRSGGWITADPWGGWTCCVEQGWYGHRARKATWLYYRGTRPPWPLKWGPAPGEFAKIDLGFHSTEERRRAIKTGVCQRMSRRQREATPAEFRDVLISLVREGCQ